MGTWTAGAAYALLFMGLAACGGTPAGSFALGNGSEPDHGAQGNGSPPNPFPTTGSGEGAGSTTGGSTTSGTSGATSDGGTTCVPAPVPACDAPTPSPGPARPFRHLGSRVITAQRANHRGRDLFVNPGEAQWVIAKFAYGLSDRDLKDEDVDVYLNRGCGTAWEFLGTATTTNGGEHTTEEGVEDSGGRVYLAIPAAKALAIGRHRVRLVVAGDLTATELFVEVVAPHTPVFVSDVDGTLTTSENAEFGALLSGALPDANPDAAAALTALAEKGYRPLYLTARPEWLVDRTREFLSTAGFPPGLVHTTLGLTGAQGTAASSFKTDELAALAAKGLTPAWAFGNTDTDAAAYQAAGINPLTQRLFFRFTDAVHGGRRIDSYGTLLPEIGALPPVCP